jgi:hypothetical protein
MQFFARNHVCPPSLLYMYLFDIGIKILLLKNCSVPIGNPRWQMANLTPVHAFAYIVCKIPVFDNSHTACRGQL